MIVSIYPKAEKGLIVGKMSIVTVRKMVSIYPKAEKGLIVKRVFTFPKNEAMVSIYPKAEKGLIVIGISALEYHDNGFNLPEGREGFNRR